MSVAYRICKRQAIALSRLHVPLFLLTLLPRIGGFTRCVGAREWLSPGAWVRVSGYHQVR